jgi:hypothetical protein
MSYEQRDNSGSLFRNESDNPKAPTHTGKCRVNGVDMRISAWVKEGKSGKFFSLAFDPLRDKPAKPAPKPEPDDSDVPW